MYSLLNRILLLVFIFSFVGLKSQCIIPSTGCGGYNVSISISPQTVIPSTTSCPYGYNYNIGFSYSVIVSGVNTCNNGNIGIQPKIICGGQTNAYSTLYVSAPIVGAAASSVSYSGNLITSSNQYQTTADCNTSTPASLGCNNLQVTIFGPGISTATYSCSMITLPIELGYFRGKCVNNSVEFEWATYTEINNEYFTIEKSTDALNWESVSVLKGAGFSSNLIKYAEHYKEAKSDFYYYRLKQTDTNGNFQYSDIITLENACSINPILRTVLSPNPSHGSLSVLGSNLNTLYGSIFLYTMLGENVFSFTGNLKDVDVSHLDSGVYILQYSQPSQTITMKFILEK